MAGVALFNRDDHQQNDIAVFDIIFINNGSNASWGDNSKVQMFSTWITIPNMLHNTAIFSYIS